MLDRNDTAESQTAPVTSTGTPARDDLPRDYLTMTIPALRDLRGPEITALIEAATKQLAAWNEAEKKRLTEKWISEATRSGLDLAAIVGTGRARPVRKSPAAAAKPAMRHPDDPSLTWNGTGRQPTWYKDLVDSGRAPVRLKS